MNKLRIRSLVRWYTEHFGEGPSKSETQYMKKHFARGESMDSIQSDLEEQVGLVSYRHQSAKERL